MRSLTKRGFTLIELLVVIAIIAILASILFPVFAKAREKARQTTCLSQVRQMATGIQMYNQDNNGRYPGSGWVDAISGYLGANSKMFLCPSDSTSDADSVVSYGYSGILLRVNGEGVNEAQIKAPTEVGCIADSSPSRTYPTGGIIGGGGQLVEADVASVPASRHSNGVIIGYCDGHAKYVPRTFDEKDMGNDVTRAFYQASALGLVDNPAGGMPAGVSVTASGALTIGGEYCTYPLITAAAEVYKNKGGSYASRGFLGESYTSGSGLNYLWGRTSNGAGTASVIGHDVVVVIVAKNSALKTNASGSLGSLTNSTYNCSTATIGAWFTQNGGYSANAWQAYTYNNNSSTRGTFTGAFAAPGQNAVTVANDVEMVDKVANDRYGIGYCSSVFADPQRVTILAINGQYFPTDNTKYRYVMPTITWDTTANTWTGWPSNLMRTLYADGGGVGGENLEQAMSAGTIGTALRGGPMFKCSYW